MVDFTRRKSLESEFAGIRITENDLASIARAVQKVSSDYDGAPNIRIITADREEAYKTESPEFFESGQMPTQIDSVSINYTHYQNPIECSISFSAGPDGFAKLSVEGTDPKVADLFHDLNREIGSKAVFSTKLVKFLDSIWAHIILNPLVALAVYSLFDATLDFASARYPAFEGSTGHYAIGLAGWIAVFAALVLGGFPIVRNFKRCFPKLEFSGRLSDRYTRKRTVLVWIFSGIVLPILLRLF